MGDSGRWGMANILVVEMRLKDMEGCDIAPLRSP